MLGQNDPLWPLYYAIGAVVASSRVYVKIHHPSDVVAGAVVGIVLAQVARRVWPFPRSRPRRSARERTNPATRNAGRRRWFTRR